METKIILAVPVADSGAMKARTAHSIGIAIMGARTMVVDFLLRMSCDITSSRTWLVQEAIKRGGTHILFIDSDMNFGEDTITRLVAHDKDIVGVEYNKREFPLTGVYKPLEEKKDELYKAAHVGTGLLLIKLSVFEKMTDDAWFKFGRDSQGAIAIGEDVWFCNSARDKGFDVWIDPTIKCGHVGEYVY